MAERAPEEHAGGGEDEGDDAIVIASETIGISSTANETPTARASILVATASTRRVAVPLSNRTLSPSPPRTASAIIFPPIRASSRKAIQGGP